jgi:hypothetical protein
MQGRFTEKFRLQASDYTDAHLDGIFAKDAGLKDFLARVPAASQATIRRHGLTGKALCYPASAVVSLRSSDRSRSLILHEVCSIYFSPPVGTTRVGMACCPCDARCGRVDMWGHSLLAYTHGRYFCPKVSGPAILAGLHIQHAFEAQFGREMCRNFIEEYAAGGLGHSVPDITYTLCADEMATRHSRRSVSGILQLFGANVSLHRLDMYARSTKRCWRTTLLSWSDQLGSAMVCRYGFGAHGAARLIWRVVNLSGAHLLYCDAKLWQPV